MAEITRVGIKVELKVVLELDEQEAGALDAIFGYNADAFLKAFKEKMGKAYVEPYEDGVRSLHKRIRGLMQGPLGDLKKARNAAYAALRPLK